jgi:hypothetical protein
MNDYEFQKKMNDVKKPDVIMYAAIGMYKQRTFYIHKHQRSHSQIRLYFDGNNGHLKNVEMLR